MIGYKDSDANYDFSNMIYGLYFDDSVPGGGGKRKLIIFEDGNNRGEVGEGWSLDYPYKVKIVLKLSGGAKYYIQGDKYEEYGSNNWTLLYDSNYSTEKYLKIGFTNNINSPLVPTKVKTAMKMDDIYVTLGSTPLFIKNVMIRKPTFDSVTVLIQTNINSNVTLNYGTSETYGLSASSENKTLHEINLIGLIHAASYNYEIIAHESGNSSNIGKRSNLSFRTQFKKGNNFTFSVIGDIQRCDISDVIQQLESDPTDIIVTVGDNIGGERAKTMGDYSYRWQADFFDYLQNLTNSKPLFQTAGNHDRLDNDLDALAVYQRILLSSKKDVGGKRYYSFDYGDAHFVILDANKRTFPARLDEEQLSWLDADLTATDKPWKFVFSHYLVYGAGDVGYINTWRISNYSDIHEILVKNKATAYFNGHRHVYNRYMKDGVLYISNLTAGVGGCLLEGSKFGNNNYVNTGGDTGTIPTAIGNIAGYIKVNVTPSSAKIIALQNNGSQIDFIEIKK